MPADIDEREPLLKHATDDRTPRRMTRSPPVTRQLLFYEQAVPVDVQRHRAWAVQPGHDYAFARNVNSVPVTALEFPSAAMEYAIVFASAGDAVFPMAVLGVRDKQNLYLTETGGWDTNYIPAYVRRYPFVFSSSDAGKTFTLFIDESFAGCNEEGRGERLFDAAGNRTQFLEKVLKFLRTYEAEFRRTGDFCARLKELGLLEPMRARFGLASGAQVSLSGFMVINRERLKGLAGERLVELAGTDELELIYLHLHSLRNVAALAARLEPQTAGAAE
jgi:hypothetical protein